ncbi:sigma-54-dependent Fis family transcriptional regulator [Pseudorhodoferax aquiterrae]|uniref:Sigma-54-dependent Fis family transcriptional regulator n=1 Tax=Pseudorhodoferax aquiterrae TaxID=747304 RepID=A0ABQ3G1L0_9BURK|nr:sigma 54-interacting transcriptional regulator [Pseudorhodoferax aquiterrae]GHC83406.1 sigma-54-dependent Fis family transcriptional regulator [Pseudorhodoferax aquiterrae]
MPEEQISAASLGVLVRRQGAVVAALGLAAVPATQQALAVALAAAGDRTLFALPLPLGPGIATALRADGLEVVLLRPADSGATLLDFVAAVPFAFDILEQILSDPYQGITVADHTGTMRYVSPVHEKFLGLPPGGGAGKPVEQVIRNSRLRAVVASGKAEIGQPLEFGNAVTRVVNRRPVRRDGQVIGAVGQVMFRDTEAVAQMAAEMQQLRTQLEFYRRELDGLRESRGAVAELVGDSQAMQRLREEVAAVARLDVPVLVQGESGTGKELVVRAIHALGRPGQALVSLNLAAVPESLVESELFGHAAGAFTGSARQGRPGKFEMANAGTLFLDEVGDIPMDVQIKLLRVLEERVAERLGSHAARPLSFRLVSATHRDIGALIDGGAFRHDLFYRISGVRLQVPPLRERLEDIPALLAHFVLQFCQRNGRPMPCIDPDVAAWLAEQPWPGNLRQLRHRIEEALVFSPPERLALAAFGRGEALRAAPAPQQQAAAPARLKDHERSAALRTLAECGGNKKRAAERLGISRSYLYKLLGESAASRRSSQAL